DVVDSVADGLQVFQVLVVDAEVGPPLAQLLLEGLDQLDERQRVGFEVVGEAGALGDGGRLDLQDVRKAVADQLEYLLSVHGCPRSTGPGGQAMPGLGVWARVSIPASRLCALVIAFCGRSATHSG